MYQHGMSQDELWEVCHTRKDERGVVKYDYRKSSIGCISNTAGVVPVKSLEPGF